MRRQLLGSSLLLAAFVLALPGADALGQDKKKKGGDKPKATAIDSGKLKAGEFTGTMVSAPGTDRTFLLEIESKNAVLTGVKGGGKGRPATPQYKWNVVKSEVEFQLSDKVKVRTLTLPEQFDEKGNIKRYTDKEKRDMKGKDTNLPGYESSLDKLEAGQVVSLRLVAAPAKAAAKDKDATDEAKPDKKMQVNLIVIRSESSGSTTPMPKGKPKK